MSFANHLFIVLLFTSELYLTSYTMKMMFVHLLAVLYIDLTLMCVCENYKVIKQIHSANTY